MSDVPGRPAVDVRQISRRFKEVRAVDGVSFEIGHGEIFGLLGPNGAGKTTTIRILVTLLPPDSGHAEVFGLDVVRQTMEVRRRIGYVPQQLSADGSLSGWENVMLFARLYDLPWRARKEAVSSALALMGLADAKDRLAATYSGGMVRRLELAQALINQPRLLVLDEPTIGLDPIARGEVWDHVQTLRHNLGTTILMTTHYMEEAERLCDRVALMSRGQIRAIGTPEGLKQQLGAGATLEDVFRHFAGEHLDAEGGSLKDVRATRRTARRVG
ncbi:MAG TPA: ATP-binding cassette domain-containing protein [Candidatus Sulfotelmatobacter sp.]|nr:ATP-binding cassette domain-containing protein [Candidatus Sulfotelmatobacter sp.]